jgi:sulfur-carrier protein
VAFYGPLRPIVGARLLTIRLPEHPTLRQLLHAVLDTVPALGPQLVDDHGQPHPYVHLFVNGRDHPYLADQLETRLEPEDRVDVFPATAGGCIGKR